MKRAIEASEIREGDVVRWEPGVGTTNYRAIEYLAGCDGDQQAASGAYYLLDRPKPAVELPIEPALGWVETANVGAALGIWYMNDRNPRPEQLLNHKTRSQRYRRDITAFTPATAVPTSALDELRESWGGCEPSIGKFLAAIDAAGDAS